jgi:hypothetical protein
MYFLKPRKIRVLLAGSTLIAACLVFGYRNSEANATVDPIAAHTMATQAALVPAVAMPLCDTDRTFCEQIKGEAQSMHMSHVANDEVFPWRITWGNRIDHVGVAEDGTIVLGRTEDLKHDAVSVFTPPLPLVPAMKVGEQITPRPPSLSMTAMIARRSKITAPAPSPSATKHNNKLAPTLATSKRFDSRQHSKQTWASHV